ncbi:MAG: hypothetical protein NW205_08685 [Hyphomicrobiaceae bacterium]|nr:hypothetical protein [Hyphomicrobiaceae bacterium]
MSRYPATRVAAATAALLCTAGLAIGIATAAGPEVAPSPPGAAGRYTMSPVEGGFLRLDTVTGAVSMCAKSGSGWACEPLPDNARQMTDEVDRLKSENDKLKDDLRRMEDEFVGAAPKDGLPGPRGVPNVQLPSEKDVDQAVDYLEGLIRKFRERFENFGDKTDPNRPPHGGPALPDERAPGAPVPRTSTPL